MFRFEHTEFLIWLWIFPVLIGLYMWVHLIRKRRIATLGSSDLISLLAPGLSDWRILIKSMMRVSVLLFLLIALANPQWGNKKEKVKAKSSDVYIALDISQSMMAEDVSPNRLERAKRLAQNIIRSLKGNRIGIILFAGNAYLQMPLSNDYGAALLFIGSANTDQAGTQGTAIGEALDLAMRAYETGKATQRAVIIITDGENHEEEAMVKAREASEAGLNIYTVGIGTTEGAFVPYMAQGREQYKRDDEGNPVKSALNIQLVEDLADAGGGTSYLIGQGNQIITGLRRDIDMLEKQEVEQRAFTDYASYFQYFLVMGIIFLIAEFMISDKNKTTIAT